MCFSSSYGSNSCCRLHAGRCTVQHAKSGGMHRNSFLSIIAPSLLPTHLRLNQSPSSQPDCCPSTTTRSSIESATREQRDDEERIVLGFTVVRRMSQLSASLLLCCCCRFPPTTWHDRKCHQAIPWFLFTTRNVYVDTTVHRVVQAAAVRSMLFAVT